MSSETAAHPRVTGAANGLAASFVFVVMLLTALALWTAIPVGWLWIGSKVATTQFPAAGPYAVVGIGIVLTIVLDAWLIGRLNALYIRITGTNRLAPMRPSWLKSMGESESDEGPRSTTVVEAVMMGSVLLAGFVFVGWFFLLAGSPIPKQ